MSSDFSEDVDDYFERVSSQLNIKHAKYKHCCETELTGRFIDHTQRMAMFFNYFRF